MADIWRVHPYREGNTKTVSIFTKIFADANDKKMEGDNMHEFEKYSFSRLYFGNNLEFFFIIGVNDSDNFTYDWDGRISEVIGYITTYINKENEQESYIYLINKPDREYENIIRYTQQFITHMYPDFDVSDWINCKICKTTITGRSVIRPYSNLIRSIIEKDIPEYVLNKL